MNKKFIILCVTILLLVSVAFNAKTVQKTLREEKLTGHVFSHRGASGEEIEHTFAAYDLAIAYGSKYIEQDLVTSKEGTLFVSHDLSAKKITGVDKQYSDLTDKEIKQLATEDGTSILTLQEVFDKYQDDINYVIELKEGGKQVEAFVDIINQNKLVKNVIVQSFDINAINKMAEKIPEMPRLLLVTNQEKLDEAITLEQVDIVSTNKELMTPSNVEKVHQAKKIYNAWTLDSTAEIKKAIELGADNYFTNYTGKALLLEKKYRK
ncbi:glycerophosphodiester phosphodiesterase [Vagococcus zengguangii]|uniref:Glycerophosphodiester phosphodiesterase n=1 Tax=Vagococcus zengguangii TaxID=2571750 RepID=A0A4D7CZW1_9ENTE|nr:glycerophosphodiester phosphodiesterase [Vagococcus zengguangii]QCI87056.1 glycerophosphodiester phosphodiesterase [Vagococcus zengguangii]TLG80905.1 glycerophosphodiester phosphodiesterase [Vagococcus zengguangii]